MKPLESLPISTHLARTFRNLHQFRFGGPTETLSAIAIAASVVSVLPPMSGIGPLIADSIASAMESRGLPAPAIPGEIITGVIAGSLAAIAAGWIFWRISEPVRKSFTLPSTVMIESDEPPVRAFSTGGLLIGYTTDKGEPFFMPDWNLFRHLWIIGMSGMGKTVAGSLMMFQQIQRGGGLLFVDGKLDYDNIDTIYRYAAWCGRAHEVKIINPGDPKLSNTYSPVFNGDAFEVTSRIMALVPEDPGADYYRGEATDALMTIIGAIQATGKRFTIEDLVILLNNSLALEELETDLARRAPAHPALRKLRLWLDRFRVPMEKKDNPLAGKPDIEKIKKNLGGVSSKIAAFASGDFGEVLNTYAPEVRLDEEITGGGIVYVALPTMGKQEAAYPFAKMLVGDVKTVCSWLQKDPAKRPKIPFMCFLDEARSYISESWGVFFEQARSAGLFLMPAFQTLPQDSTEADTIDRVVGNTTSKMFFRLGTPETAEKAADHIGEVRRATRTMGESEGAGVSANTTRVSPGVMGAQNESAAINYREAEEHLVSAKALQGLDIGEAIFLYEGRHVMDLRIPAIEFSTEMKRRLGKTNVNRRRYDATANKLGLNLAKRVDGLLSVKKAIKKTAEVSQ